MIRSQVVIQWIDKKERRKKTLSSRFIGIRGRGVLLKVASWGCRLCANIAGDNRTEAAPKAAFSERLGILPCSTMVQSTGIDVLIRDRLVTHHGLG